MSGPTAARKTWEGKLVAGKFPLKQWVGGSDHSAVFLTELTPAGSQKAAIKLIAAGANADAELSRWAQASKRSHPHLIRLFEHGRSEIDGIPVLYVVMEYAEENLAEIIPVRPLSAPEALEMVRPAAQALDFIHQSGFVHGSIKPSNIMAAGNELKISSDSLQGVGKSFDRPRDAYSAPERERGILVPASDMWSLGMLLLSALTQREPAVNGQKIDIPAGITQPLRQIIERCLEPDAGKRCSAKEILGELSPRTSIPQTRPIESGAHVLQDKVKQSFRLPAIAAVAAALIFAIWLGAKLLVRQPLTPEERSASTAQPAPAQPQPLSGTTSKSAPAPGHVLHQQMPDVSPGALRTIHGHFEVIVEVAVDPSGNVSNARVTSAGPSRYFSTRALAAARDWKFAPAQSRDGSVDSKWVLQFQFARASMQVLPKELKP